LGEALEIESFSTVEKYDFFNIHLSEDLIAGESYGIYIPYFTATISNSRLDGMYLDSYVDPVNNETK
jgi:carboxypeptidase C (cathepsin A)